MGITHQYFIIIDTVAARNYACYSREGHCKKTHAKAPRALAPQCQLNTTKDSLRLALQQKVYYHYCCRSSDVAVSMTSRFPVNFPRHNNINSTRKTSTEPLFVLQIRSGCFRNITTIDIFQTEDYTFHSERFTTTVTHYSIYGHYIYNYVVFPLVKLLYF